MGFLTNLFKRAGVAPEVPTVPDTSTDATAPEGFVYCKCLRTFLEGPVRYEAGEVCKFSLSDAKRFGSHGWVDFQTQVENTPQIDLDIHDAKVIMGDSNG